MIKVTYYSVQAFEIIDGDLVWTDSIECKDVMGAVTVAGALARMKQFAGAVAYSVTRDVQKQTQTVLLGSFGQVLDDFRVILEIEPEQPTGAVTVRSQLQP